MEQQIKEFKGLYTNIDDLKRPLEFCKDSSGYRFIGYKAKPFTESDFKVYPGNSIIDAGICIFDRDSRYPEDLLNISISLNWYVNTNKELYIDNTKVYEIKNQEYRIENIVGKLYLYLKDDTVIFYNKWINKKNEILSYTLSSINSTDIQVSDIQVSYNILPFTNSVSNDKSFEKYIRVSRVNSNGTFAGSDNLDFYFLKTNIIYSSTSTKKVKQIYTSTDIDFVTDFKDFSQNGTNFYVEIYVVDNKTTSTYYLKDYSAEYINERITLLKNKSLTFTITFYKDMPDTNVLTNPIYTFIPDTSSPTISFRQPILKDPSYYGKTTIEEVCDLIFGEGYTRTLELGSFYVITGKFKMYKSPKDMGNLDGRFWCSDDNGNKIIDDDLESTTTYYKYLIPYIGDYPFNKITNATTSRTSGDLLWDDAGWNGLYVRADEQELKDIKPVPFYKSMKLLNTIVINDDLEIIIGEEVYKHISIDSSYQNEYLKHLEIGKMLEVIYTKPTEYKITQIKTYIKEHITLCFDETSVENDKDVFWTDWQLLYTLDIYRDKKLDLVNGKYTKYLNAGNISGISLSQNIAFLYNEENKSKYSIITKRIVSANIEKYNFTSDGTKLYYSSVGNGIVQTDLIYKDSYIELNKPIKAIRRLSNDKLGVCTPYSMIVLGIQVNGTNLSIIHIDELEFGCNSQDDLIEVQGGVIVNSQHGLYLTNGFEKQLVSEPINNICLSTNSKDTWIYYNRYTQDVFYIIPNFKTSNYLLTYIYIFSFIHKTWSKVNIIGFKDIFINNNGETIIIGDREALQYIDYCSGLGESKLVKRLNKLIYNGNMQYETEKNLRDTINFKYTAYEDLTSIDYNLLIQPKRIQ